MRGALKESFAATEKRKNSRSNYCPQEEAVELGYTGRTKKSAKEKIKGNESQPGKVLLWQS